MVLRRPESRRIENDDTVWFFFGAGAVSTRFTATRDLRRTKGI
jgi:hypothetical protein